MLMALKTGRTREEVEKRSSRPQRSLQATHEHTHGGNCIVNLHPTARVSTVDFSHASTPTHTQIYTYAARLTELEDNVYLVKND